MILFFPVLVLLFLLLGLWLAHKGGRFAQQKYQHKVAYLGGFAIVFLLIFGDEIVTWTSWHRMCKVEGGVHVYKKVPVDGFFYDDGALSDHDGVVADFLTREGFKYKYIEGHQLIGYDSKKTDGPFYRYSLDDNEVVKGVPIDKLQSQYAYTHKKISTFHYAIWLYETAITEMITKTKNGVTREFGTRGGFILEHIYQFVGAREGSATYCGMKWGDKDLVVSTIPSIESIKGGGHE